MRKGPSVGAGLLAACAALVSTAPARADERGAAAALDPPDLPNHYWHPTYEPDPVTGVDFAVIGAAGATAIGMAIANPRPQHWVGGVGFDDAARDALRVRSLSGRYAIRDVSDVGLSLATSWPLLIDALVTTWWFHGDAEAAKRMAVVDAEAMAIAGALGEATTTLASRQRPYADACGSALPDKSVDCDGNVKYRSFFSGHSALSFTGASLVCVQHVGMNLIGGPWDTVTCVVGYGVATATATFRVMGDMHWASDVLTGAAVGTAVGLGVPLLRRHRVGAFQVAGARVHVVPIGLGLGLGGAF